MWYILDKQLYVTNDGGQLNVTCEALYGFDNNQSIYWNWTKNGINLNESLYNYYDYKIVNNDLEHLSTRIINNANLTYSGDYECILFNKYGNASRQMKIRIKS